MMNNVLPQKFPFTAVAGQPLFKLALILAAINPRIGGVLVSGPRGSAKSTLARALADILPVQSAADKLNTRKTPPFVTLPLGASEESVIGTINLQQVLHDKKVEFQAGLLAKADDGILYVDEVNLLPDHLVDLLLDVSASGVNIVERDGVSHSHRANFILLGTMNPDEGELRPQLQDRFGLSVELTRHYSIEERMSIVRLREQFDKTPENFTQQYQDQQQQLASKIAHAQQGLAAVECANQWREHIAHRCAEANVDGVRADIIWHRAAVAHAAWQQRDSVNEEDVNAVEELVLTHRRQFSSSPKDKPPTPPSPSQESSSDSSSQNASQKPSQKSPFLRPPESKASSQSSVDNQREEVSQTAGDWGSMQPMEQATASVEYSALAQKLAGLTPAQKKQSARSASVSNQKSSKKSGVELDSNMVSGANKKACASQKIHWFQSLLASVGEWPLKTFRYHPKKTQQSVLHLFLLDTSASTLQNQWFAQAKASVVSIAEKIYLDREQLTVMGFGNQKVDVLLPQRRAPKSLKVWLDAIPAGGGTPLREVIQQAYQFQQQQIRRLPSLQIKTYLVTDGRTSQVTNDFTLLGEVVVIDIESSSVKRGKAKQIADVLKAHYLPLAT